MVSGILRGNHHTVRNAPVSLETLATDGVTWTVVASGSPAGTARCRSWSPARREPATVCPTPGDAARALHQRDGGQLSSGHGSGHRQKESALERALSRTPACRRAVSAARTGDEAAFVTLWRALHPPLLRYLTVRGDEAPEDIASETWMHVVKGLAGFEGDAAAFRAWLFTIARHRAVDQGRARTRRPAVTVGEPAELPAREVAPSAEDQVVARTRPPGPSSSSRRCRRRRRRW